jgi:hypothetical protein
MFVGLLTTAVTTLAVASWSGLIQALFDNRMVFLVLLIAVNLFFFLLRLTGNRRNHDRKFWRCFGRKMSSELLFTSLVLYLCT